jgi:hypothetical protein
VHGHACAIHVWSESLGMEGIRSESFCFFWSFFGFVYLLGADEEYG